MVYALRTSSNNGLIFGSRIFWSVGGYSPLDLTYIVGKNHTEQHDEKNKFVCFWSSCCYVACYVSQASENKLVCCGLQLVNSYFEQTIIFDTISFSANNSLKKIFPPTNYKEVIDHLIGVAALCFISNSELYDLESLIPPTN